MYSDNYIEVMLTGFGWDFYGKFAMFIYTLNLHFIPFILVILNNWRETRRSQDAGAASIVESRRNMIDVASMMFIAVFFWIPSQNTTFKAAEHVQAIQAKAQGIEGSAAYKTMNKVLRNGQAISDVGEIPIPPGWYFMLYLTKASINQVKEWIGTDSLGSMKTLLSVYNSLDIKDPDLRFETNKFFSACYIPSLRRYQNETLQPIPVLAEKDDLNYIGNELFKTTPGYYKPCTQNQMTNKTCYGRWEVMPLEVASKYAVQTDFVGQTPNEAGNFVSYINQPSCNTWWTGENDFSYTEAEYTRTGLLSRLATHSVGESILGIDKSGLGIDDGVTGFFSMLGISISGDRSAEDELVRQLLKTEPPEAMITENKSNDTTWMQDIADWAQGSIAWVGVGLTTLTLGIVLEVLKPALMLFQAGMIFAIIMMIAIVLPIGGFKIETTIKLGIFLFSILILSLWWHIAGWIDEAMITVFYPGLDGFEDIDAGFNSFLYLIFTFFFYIMVPGYFTKLIAMAGFEAGEISSDAISGARNAGDRGAKKVGA